MKIFVETSKKLPIVSIAIGFRTGSLMDPAGKEGLARTTARMFRRGTATMSAESLEDRIDSLGAEFGADASLSNTTIHAEVIARNLGPFVAVLKEIIGAPAFDPVELGKLLREAEAEIIEARDSDRTLASRALRRTLFEGHPLGRRVAGLIPTLAALTESDVRTHYRTQYARADAVVAFSGSITDTTARDVAEELLSGLPLGQERRDRLSEPTPERGRRLVVVDKPQRTQTQMGIGWLGSHPADEDHFAWLLGNTTFGGTFTSRLMQEVRAKRGWSYGASSRVGFDRHRDAFTMWTAPSEKDAPACLALELELLEKLRDDGLTPEELEFTKKYLGRSHAFEIDTARKRVHQHFEEALFDLPEGYHQRYLEELARTSLDEVNAALKKRTPVEDLVVSVVATAASSQAGLEQALPGRTRSVVLSPDFE